MKSARYAIGTVSNEKPFSPSHLIRKMFAGQVVQRLWRCGGLEQYGTNVVITVDSYVISHHVQSEDYTCAGPTRSILFPRHIACYRRLVQNANTVPSLVIDYQRHAGRAGQWSHSESFSSAWTLSSYEISKHSASKAFTLPCPSGMSLPMRNLPSARILSIEFN